MKGAISQAWKPGDGVPITVTTSSEHNVEAASARGASPIRLSACLGLVGAFWVFMLIFGRFLRLFSVEALMASKLHVGLFVVVTAIGATVLWLARRFLYRVLTSPPFAASLLTALLLATALGTVLLQAQPEAEYTRSYGSAFAPAMIWLGLDDIFHTAWFNSLLFVLAASVVLVAIKRRAWRRTQWGFLCAHLGAAAILVGGLLGNLFGFKGNIDLHEGKSASEAVVGNRKAHTVERRELGFSIRLEDFEVEKYDPEFRFYIFKKQGKSFKTLRSIAVEDAGKPVPIGEGGAEFRVLRMFPDFYEHRELREEGTDQGRPALRITVGEGEQAQNIHLFTDGGKQDHVSLSPQAPLIRFVWERPTDDELAKLAESEPEKHVLSFQKDSCCPAEEAAVEPGKTKTLTLDEGLVQVRVLSYIPDFFYNMKEKRPGTRSQRPNNPALQVAVKTAGSEEEKKQWLFAKMPDFGQQHGKEDQGPKLVYQYTAAKVPPLQEVLIIGQSREVWQLERGKIVKQTALESAEGAIPGDSHATFRIFGAAVEDQHPATRSQEWKNPVAEVELREGTEVTKHLMAATHSRPVRLKDGETYLNFQPKDEEVKAYRSRLAVLEGGEKVAEQTIEVNHPLTYRGVKFYQSNYRKDDPTYSGIQVVKDPGLPLVWAGFIMISVGVAFCFYVKPRLLQRRKA